MVDDSAINDNYEAPFHYEGRQIFLRCTGDSGEHLGDLRIATAEMEGHADTLVNAANAGMRFMQSILTDRAITKILDEHTGEGGAAGSGGTS